MEKRAAVALIGDDDGTDDPYARLLCVWNRRYKCWGLPGGKAEEGEPVRDCLRRELEEECGILAGDFDEVYARRSSVESERMVHAFKVHTFAGQPVEVEEGCPVKWMSPGELIAAMNAGMADYMRGLFAAVGIAQ